MSRTHRVRLVVNEAGLWLGDVNRVRASGIDPQWLADQLDMRPRFRFGLLSNRVLRALGLPERPPGPDLYRWPGAFLGVVEDVPSAERPSPSWTDGERRPAPGAGSTACADGDGSSIASGPEAASRPPTAGEPRPVRIVVSRPWWRP